MSLQLNELREQNDAFRKTLRGGTVLFTPAVLELPSDFRGRLLYRLTLIDSFDPDSDHSEGVVIFAGYSFFWRIQQFAGERSLIVMLKDDL